MNGGNVSRAEPREEVVVKSLALILAVVALAGVAGPAAASERDQLQRVADEAGVTIDDVRMVLGARTAFAQYRTSYDRKAARVHAAMVKLALEQPKQDARKSARSIASK
jgi:hypothetical protein